MRNLKSTFVLIDLTFDDSFVIWQIAFFVLLIFYVPIKSNKSKIMKQELFDSKISKQ